MSIVKTVDRTPAPGKLSPRYLRRRAGDDKAVSEHRKAIGLFDPLAATGGVSSCHYQRRVSDDKAMVASVAAAVLVAKPCPPTSSNVPELQPNVDQGTPELRLRVLEAAKTQPRKHLSWRKAWSLVAGQSIVP